MAVKKVTILLCCFAALTVCAIFFLNSNGTRQQEKILSVSSEKSMSNYFTSNATSSQENSSATATLASGSNVYIVKEYKGHIGVYRNNEAKPFREYQTDVLVLPKNDQVALERGKVVRTMAEVEKLVEDYDS